MAAPARTPASAWVEAGLEALGSGGPEAVRVDPLARSLGVTRGSFYWHFADRDALLTELLNAWERAATDDVLDRVERHGGDARTRLRRAGALTFSEQLLPIDLAVRDWARHDPAVAGRLRRVDNRRLDYLRTLFGTFCADADEVEARSTLAFSLLIGSHFLAADHPGRSRAEALELAADWLLA
ncbi:MAG TPA: TetR/AcrR family transcriptional regulator [Streptosporangiaceae bacterium]